MTRYEKIDVSEQQLEDLVRRFTDYIESGLRYVDNQLTTNGGRLDVLMVDSGKSLVVAELKIIEDDDMLLQGLDYYDYVTEHRESYARLFQQHDIDPTQDVRLLLIAPSFSIRMINRCKWINAPISLFRFDCLQFEDTGEITPVFNEQTIPSKPQVLEKTTKEELLNWITDESALKRANKFLAETKTWGQGVSQDAIQSAISVKVNGRVVAYLYPRRRYFLLGTHDEDGEWNTSTVKSEEDYMRILKQVRDCFEKKK